MGSLGFHPAIISPYQAWTGSGNTYGFFAPGVALESRIRYIVEESGGSVFVGVLAADSGFEVGLRLSTIAGQILSSDNGDLIAASVGSWVLAQNADNSVVHILVEVYETADSTGDCAGRRPYWRLADVYTFARDDSTLKSMH